MKLVLDIGNSYTKMAMYEGYEAQERLLVHKDEESAETAMLWLEKADSVAISTVGRCSQVENMAIESGKPLFRLSGETPLPFVNGYLTPETLGLDRVAGMLGAYATHEGVKDFLIMDLGTCNTYDIILDNRFVGGNIAPGLQMRMKAMHEFTAKLPFLEPRDNHLVIGRNTREAMECGALTGVADEVNCYMLRFRKDAPEGICIMTGGYSELVMNRVQGMVEYNPFLVPDGLNYAALCQSKK
ncbi:MAG: type III pantothenate kinase [Paludibacteraceae bacterium]|nr:type III pantothenate kinase [Paludibacteraceae bacterium]